MSDLLKEFLYKNEICTLQKKLSDQEKQLLEAGKKALIRDGVVLTGTIISEICRNSSKLKQYGFVGPILGPAGLLIVDICYLAQSSSKSESKGSSNSGNTLSFRGRMVYDGSDVTTVPEEFTIDNVLAQVVVDCLF